MTLCNKSETTGAVTINIDSFLLIIHQPRSTDLFGVKKIPRNQKDLIRVSGTAVTRWSTTKILPKACFRAKCPAENIWIGIFDSEFRPSLNWRSYRVRFGHPIDKENMLGKINAWESRNLSPNQPTCASPVHHFLLICQLDTHTSEVLSWHWFSRAPPTQNILNIILLVCLPQDCGK